MKTTPCKGCGKPIVFVVAKKDDGTTVRIPLDIRAPVYVAIIHDQDDTPINAIRMKTAYVSHFATCPKASDFSKKKAPAATGASGGTNEER